MSATAGSGPGQYASVAVGENSKREAASCGRQIERSGYADELRIHGEGELRAEEEEKRIRGVGKDWYRPAVALRRTRPGKRKLGASAAP